MVAQKWAAVARPGVLTTVGKTSDRRYSTQRWRRLRLRALERDGWRCTHAGCNTDLRGRGVGVVDHIWEVNDGGPFWDLGNLQSLCWSHHQAKTHTTQATRTQATPVSPNA